MENAMDYVKIKALAAEMAKDLKTPADLNALSAQRTNVTVEAERSSMLRCKSTRGTPPTRRKGGANTSSRNGYTANTLKGDHGQIEIATPRDREATFELQLMRKGQTRITGMDGQIHYF